MLQVTAKATDPREVDTDLVILPVFKGGIEGPGTNAVLRACGLRDFPVTPTFRGDIGQHLRLAAPGVAAHGMLLIGLGRMDEVDTARLRRAAGVAAAAARDVRRVATTLAEVHATPAAVEAVAEGLHLGAHADRRFTTNDDAPPRLSEAVVLAPSSRLSQARVALEQAAVYAQATIAARELVNTPPDRKRPDALADALCDLARAACTTRVRGPEELADDGFGAITAVGRGSSVGPRLVELRYEPASPLGHVVLIGKGVTFDSGGLSLKRGNAMADMKSDMAGAAAVAAACSALGDLGVRLQVTALLPLVENLPSGRAVRPDDVVQCVDGTTIEVRDTDAEGRLILADALAHACTLAPDAIVDLATLTGSVVGALGQYAAGIMGSDDELVEALRGAAAVAGEDVWPLPLWSRLERFLESPVADVNNTGDGPGGGALTAGLFLQRFTGEVPWAHLDIAGPAFLTTALAEGELPVGGTGFGVRTLLAWLERRTA